MSNVLIDAKIRDIQSAAQARQEKRDQQAAQLAERQARADAESRQTYSPADLVAREKAAATWKYWQDIWERNEARERQDKIRAANPTLIKLKTDFMKPETTSTRRGQLITEFVELYRRAYRKQVDINLLVKEWDAERRKAFLMRIYGSGSDHI